MINLQALAMYLLAWVTVSYLIYRYGRYSPWRSTLAGQSVMIVKTSLWALLTWGILAVLVPDAQDFRDIARTLLMGYVNVALIFQACVIVKYQGGLRRKKPLKAEDDRRISPISS